MRVETLSPDLWDVIRRWRAVYDVGSGGWIQRQLLMTFLFLLHLGLQLCADAHQILVAGVLHVLLHKLHQALDFCLGHLEPLPLSRQSILLLLGQSQHLFHQFCLSLFQNDFQMMKRMSDRLANLLLLTANLGFSASQLLVGTCNIGLNPSQRSE